MSGHVEEDNLEKIPLNTVSLKSKQGVNLLREEISKLSPMNATFPLTGNISPEETGGAVNLHLVSRGLQVSSQVLERREQVLLHLSKGYNQRETSRILKVDESIISRDVKALEKQASTFIEDLAKKTFGFKYLQSLTGINAVVKEAWQQWNIKKEPRYLSILLDAYTKHSELGKHLTLKAYAQF